MNEILIELIKARSGCKGEEDFNQLSKEINILLIPPKKKMERKYEDSVVIKKYIKILDEDYKILKEENYVKQDIMLEEKVEDYIKKNYDQIFGFFIKNRYFPSQDNKIYSNNIIYVSIQIILTQ